MPVKSFDEKDWHRLIASAIAGATCNLAGHPFDSIKVRMQSSSRDKVSVLTTFKRMWQKEGPSSFFRGAMPPVTGRFVITAWFFTLNGYCKESLIDYRIKNARKRFDKNMAKENGCRNNMDINKMEKESRVLPLSYIFGCGAFCGVVLGPMINVFELIKVQLQIDKTQPKRRGGSGLSGEGSRIAKGETGITAMQSAARKADAMFGLFNLGGVSSSHTGGSQPGRYTGAFDCAATIFRRKAYFRGLSMCTLRLVPGWGIYMATYDAWNRLFHESNTMGNNKPLDSLSGTLRIIVGGSLAGMAAWATSYPFDYIKTKMQAHPIEKWNVFHTYKRATKPLLVRDIIKDTYHSYGIKGFYRGFVPCLYRSVPVNIVNFWVYEAVFQSLQERSANRKNDD